MDAAYLLDWANLLLRWAHVVTAIAWIGSSFYFVFLDSSLTRPSAPDLLAKGVDGELWAVHGGGFYHPQKYLVAPQRLPEKLHWFFWESYATWLTGFALLTVVYLLNAGQFLVDVRVHAWGSNAAAVAAALGLVFGFWFVYNALCRLLGERDGRIGHDARVGLAVLLAVAAFTGMACALFAARAAFVLVGAMLATAMSANVMVWIIPGQRRVIAQMKAGQPVEALHGQRGKQRSVHNTYFTLPVLVAMLSNHYGFLTQSAQPWAVLMALMLAGALVRHSFVARHRAAVLGQPAPWWVAGVGVAVLLALAVALTPPARTPGAATAGIQAVPTLAEVQAVVATRCLVCHGETLAHKGVALHRPELLRQHATAVLQQVVHARTMPLNNATGMTDEERQLLARWVTGGMP